MLPISYVSHVWPTCDKNCESGFHSWFNNVSFALIWPSRLTTRWILRITQPFTGGVSQLGMKWGAVASSRLNNDCCRLLKQLQCWSGWPRSPSRFLWWQHHRPPSLMTDMRMLQRYGTGVLAGTHSPMYSRTIPSLIISTTPTDSKCYWKYTPKKQPGFRAFSNSAPPPSSEMPYHK